MSQLAERDITLPLWSSTVSISRNVVSIQLTLSIIRAEYEGGGKVRVIIIKCLSPVNYLTIVTTNKFVNIISMLVIVSFVYTV